MRRLRGFRARLVITMILLVAASLSVVGIATYALVSRSLRTQLVDDGVERATFNIGVLADERQLPPGAGAAVLAAGTLPTAFLVGGATGVFVDFGESRPPYATSPVLLETPALVSAELRRLVAAGDMAYQFVNVGGRRVLVVAGRRPPAGPDFYFFSSAASLDATLARLRQVLFVGSAVLMALGLAVAFLTSRRALRPVATASAAARRMAAGDLDVRLPVVSSDELGSLAASFNSMAAALDAKLGELRAAHAREQQFVADVSHELRTPLTGLVNEAALLADHLDELSADGRRVGELLISDVGRMRRLVEDLLEISRLEAAAPDGRLDDLELGAFLDAVVAARHPSAHLDAPKGALMTVDRRSLERILVNLLDNARTHAPGAAVEVRATVHGAMLEVEVADRGPGVPSGQIDHLFDRFYKADPARGGSGTGLGLAIARQHAAQMGGTLTAEPRDGGGLRFIVRLPVTELLPTREPPVTDDEHAGPREAR